MYDVFLTAHAKIAADSAGQSLAAVGGAYHLPYYLYGIDAAQAHHYNRGGLHTAHKGWKKRFFHQVSVVLAQDGIAECHHFDAGDYQSFFLETVNDFTYQAALYCGWFEDNETLLHEVSEFDINPGGALSAKVPLGERGSACSGRDTVGKESDRQ